MGEVNLFIFGEKKRVGKENRVEKVLKSLVSLS